MGKSGSIASHYIPPIAIFLATFLIARTVYLYDLNMLDEGALLHVAERILNGGVLYRDIATGIMPGIYYLTAVLFRFFGCSVETGRYMQMVVLAVNASLVYILSLVFVKKRTALFASVFFVATSLIPYRLPNYSPVSITFVLLGLILFIHYLEKEGLLNLFLSSFFFSLAFLFKQNYGVLVFLPLALFLCIRVFRDRRFNAVLVFAAGFLIPIVFTALYFHFKGAINELLGYTFFSLFNKVVSAYYKPYPFLDTSQPFFFMEDLFNFTPFRHLTIWLLKEKYTGTEVFYVLVAFVYLLPLIVITLSALRLVKGYIHRREPKECDTALFLAAAGLFMGVFPRSDFHHLSFILPPLIVSGALLIENPLSSRTAGLVTGYAAASFVLLFFSMTLISVVLPIYSERLGLQNTPLGIERAGKIKVDKDTAAIVRNIVGYIQQKTDPEEAFLVVPTDAMYYFLAHRKNATRFPLILPGATDEQEIIDTLESKKVRYIVYADVSFDEQPFSTQLPLLHKYIRAKYHVAPRYQLRKKPAEVYILKRGPKPPDTVETINFTPEDPWLKHGAAEPVLFYDFIENLPEARSEIILESGEARPLYRENQVAHSAWLMKDVLQEIPPKNWTKVSVSYGLHVPERAALSFSIGLSPGVWFPEQGDGSLFEIYIYDTKKGEVNKVFSRYIDPKNNPDHRKWFNYLLSLKDFEGRDVIISFVTSGGPRFNLTNGRVNHWKHFDKAGWGEPRIVIPKENDETLKRIPSVSNAISPHLPEGVLKKMALFDPAIFEEEAKKHPDDFDVRFALGRVYDRLGLKKKALKEFEAAFALNPSNEWVRSLLINRSIELKRYASAEALLKDSIESDPENFQFLVSLAKLYRVTKRFKEAQKWYEKALEIRPDHKWARLGLGTVYLSLKNYDLSEKEARRVIKMDPSNSGAYILLADSLRFTGDKEGAERNYRKALELNPAHPYANAKLATLLESMGKLKEALSFFEKASRLAPGNEFFKERTKRLRERLEYRKAPPKR